MSEENIENTTDSPSENEPQPQGSTVSDSRTLGVEAQASEVSNSSSSSDGTAATEATQESNKVASPANAAEQSKPPSSSEDGQNSQPEEVSAASEKKEDTKKASSADPKKTPPDTKEQRAANQQILEELVRRIEELATSADKLKTAERWLSRADQRLSELGPLPGEKKVSLMKAFGEARRKLFIRTGELREADEWKRWANVPKQEALISRVEAFASQENSKGFAKKLKSIQNEWKEVGPAPRDKAQELWNRFKTACDAAYVKVKEERGEQLVVQKENLEKKLVLIEKAEEIAKAENENENWAKGASALKKLQNEWKAIGPVPRRQSDKIWKRFRKACDGFFEKRRPHLERSIAEQEGNLAAKIEICEQVEALAASDEDLDKSIKKVSALRNDWREIGHVPVRDFKSISDRFRKACDAVYGKKDKIRAEKTAVLVEKTNDLSKKIEEQLGVSPPSASPTDGEQPEDAPSGLGSLCVELRGLAREPEATKEMQALIDSAICNVVNAKPEALSGTELDPNISRKRKQKLIQRLTEFVAERTQGDSVSDLSSAEDMAAKLRAALADRALGGVLSKSAKEPAKDVVADVKSSWSRLGPVTEPLGSELENTFQTLCKKALDADRA